MKIVLLESLGINDTSLQQHAAPLIAAGHEFIAYPKDTCIETMIERAKDADILMIANMPLPAEVIRQCPQLKYINVAFTGVDHVALNAAKERNIQVSNAAGYSTQAVAELTIGMMIDLLRNVPQVSERCRNGATKDGLVGFELHGKTVGIVGVGAIGSKVAELCHAFGCQILGYKRHITGNEADYIRFTSLEELLQSSDIVSLHCPLTNETQHLINRERLELMKEGAYLINTARGGVVDSQALADALHRGKLRGAAIDVFENEPPLDTNHPLLHSPNTLVTPHIAFASAESMEKRAEIVFRNIHSWIEGKQENIIL